VKKLLTISLLLLIGSYGFAQIIEGTLIDGETKKMLISVNVVVKNSNKGVATDSLGKFQISIQKNDTLVITYIGRSTIQIINLPSDKKKLNIGELELIDIGSSLYVTFSKKKFLSKKTKLVCKHIDNTKKLKEEDLIVKCPDGMVSYKWELLANGLFQLDYSKLKKCKN